MNLNKLLNISETRFPICTMKIGWIWKMLTKMLAYNRRSSKSHSIFIWQYSLSLMPCSMKIWHIKESFKFFIMHVTFKVWFNFINHIFSIIWWPLENEKYQFSFDIKNKVLKNKADYKESHSDGSEIYFSGFLAIKCQTEVITKCILIFLIGQK